MRYAATTPWQDVISKLNEAPSSVDQPFHNHARPHQGEFLMANNLIQPLNRVRCQLLQVAKTNQLDIVNNCSP